MFVLTTTTTTTDMDALSIFKLVAGGASALATVYGLGRMLYVAAIAPVDVQRIAHKATRVTPPQELEIQISYSDGDVKAMDEQLEHYFRPSPQVLNLYKNREHQVA
jgi:hypothetical protein